MSRISQKPEIKAKIIKEFIEFCKENGRVPRISELKFDRRHIERHTVGKNAIMDQLAIMAQEQ